MQLEFVDAGTTSILVKGDGLADAPSATLLWRAEFAPHASVPLVSKIITDRATAASELKIAMRLSNIDPSQQYLLYPHAAYELPSDARLLERGRAFKPIPGQNVDPAAPSMFVFIMQDGGASVYEHEKRGTVLSEEQSKRVLGDLLFGLLLLHGNQIAHGDVHVHNAVITLEPPRAYWVDFGKMSESSATLVQRQRDVSNVGGVVRTILQMTDAVDFKRSMSASLSSYKTRGLQSIMMDEYRGIIVPRFVLAPHIASPSKGTPSPPKGTPVRTLPISRTPVRTLSSRTPPSPRSFSVTKKARISHKNE